MITYTTFGKDIGEVGTNGTWRCWQLERRLLTSDGIVTAESASTLNITADVAWRPPKRESRPCDAGNK